jgi:peptidoglycan-N-acetylglucosamine deacetylase
MKKVIKKIIKSSIPDNLMIHRLPRGASNSILFTFDDGPDKKITPLVLEYLEKYNVRAIFFIVGRLAQENPYILKMIISKGHCIANHSYEHPNGPLPDYLAFRNDIIKCQNAVKDILGREPCFYRPPRGVISPKSLLTAKSLHLRYINWSNEGGEWGNNKSADYSTIANNLLATLSPRDIVLLHDNHPKVPHVLDIILPIITKKFDLTNGITSLQDDLLHEERDGQDSF